MAYESDSSLIEACWKNDIQILDRLLTSDNVNSIRQKAFGNNCLLHTAAECGHVAAAELLLKKGADVNARKDEGDTPLHVAAANARIDVVNCLLKHNANIDAKNEKGWTPLFGASSKGHSEIVEILLSNNSNVNAADNFNNMALHEAAREGKVDTCKVLLKHGADKTIRNTFGKLPLDLCSSFDGKLLQGIIYIQDARKDSKTLTVTTPELAEVKKPMTVSSPELSEKQRKKIVKEYLPMGGKREVMISTNYEKLVNSLIPQGSPLLPKLVAAEVISIRAKNDVEGVGAAEKTPEKKAEMLIGIIRTLDQEKYFRFLAILATINEDQVQWLTEGKWSPSTD